MIMKDWQAIRVNRPDLTDYVIHFTRPRTDKVDEKNIQVSALQVLLEILEYGFIKPGFALLPNRSSKTARATVKGPDPAVCLTEQPLWAFLKYRDAVSCPRYSGYGIAYHKHMPYSHLGRPVLYGANIEIGRRMKEGEKGWEEGKDIFEGGLPRELQYLWVNYAPDLPDYCDYPIDFTWEREGRVKPLRCYYPKGLPVFLEHSYPGLVAGAIIVEKDADVSVVRDKLNSLAEEGKTWAKRLTRVISLETAKRRIESGTQYVQVDTWQDE